MQAISEIMKLVEEEFRNSQLEYQKRRRVAPDLQKEDFKRLLDYECAIRLMKRGDSGYFEIDEDNTKVIDQLFYYITGNQKEFKGNIDKGILLQGSIGTGKTILLRGFAGVIGKVLDRNFEYYSAFDINRLIVKEGIEKYSKRPLLIDDLGKEQEIVKDYGTDVRPILELFASRYDTGAITFLTTNYNNETFVKKYGAQTVDRFIETFNFIQLNGKSRRE
jgi:hypothetical protein